MQSVYLQCILYSVKCALCSVLIHTYYNPSSNTSTVKQVHRRQRVIDTLRPRRADSSCKPLQNGKFVETLVFLTTPSIDHDRSRIIARLYNLIYRMSMSKSRNKIYLNLPMIFLISTPTNISIQFMRVKIQVDLISWFIGTVTLWKSAILSLFYQFSCMHVIHWFALLDYSILRQFSNRPKIHVVIVYIRIPIYYICEYS